jgi:ribonucleoside-triphosphate reductase
VFDNFDHLSGVSFLPMDGGTYRQAPYQECTKEEYEAALAKMPESIDWSKLSDYEREDNTTGVRELACTAGACEIF